jgi:hypothetical protein
VRPARLERASTGGNRDGGSSGRSTSAGGVITHRHEPPRRAARRRRCRLQCFERPPHQPTTGETNDLDSRGSRVVAGRNYVNIAPVWHHRLVERQNLVPQLHPAPSKPTKRSVPVAIAQETSVSIALAAASSVRSAGQADGRPGVTQDRRLRNTPPTGLCLPAPSAPGA